MREHPGSALKACHCCGLIHELPPLAGGERAVCVRCQATLCRQPPDCGSLQRTAAAALGALILYWPAVTLPIVRIERLGYHHSASLLSGTWDLLNHGSWFVGLVVLLFSIVLPLAKIVLLIELSWLGFTPRRHRAGTYRLMEQVGKWGMLDVLLLALMVMLVKVGDLVEFHLGPAVLAFVACVIMSMLASMSFDPHSIWEKA